MAVVNLAKMTGILENVGVLFTEKRLITPWTLEKWTYDRVVNLITSIAIGIFTLGIVHFCILHRKKSMCFHLIEKDGKTLHVRTPKYWKIFASKFSDVDLSYRKPEVDVTGLMLGAREKQELTEHCLLEMKDSMKVLESSIVDGINEAIRSNACPEVLETVQKFTERILDVYEAYVHLKLDESSKVTTWLTKDPLFRLLQELEKNFEGMSKEPGFVGSPLRFLNICRGKYDHVSKDQLYRFKLFLAYGSKRFFNEITKDSRMIHKINTKLRESQKNWQLNAALISVLQSHSSAEPIFKLGVYAELNDTEKLRSWRSHEEMQQARLRDLNHTYAKAERIAASKDCSSEDLRKRFRISLHEAEEMAFLGSNSSIEKQEMQRKRAMFEIRGDSRALLRTNCDTSFLDSFLDYQKRSRRCDWFSGEHTFQVHSSAIRNSSYFAAIDALGLSQYAGISGSTDQIFTIAGIVGLQSKEELMALRTIFIPWMGGHNDHTVHEILMATVTFGLEYTPSADYYRQIYPKCQGLTALIEIAQDRRGYKLPDYYLSNEHAKAVWEAKKNAREAELNENIQGLLSSSKLILQGLRAYRHMYSLTDLFGKASWKRELDYLKYTDQAIANRIRRRTVVEPKTEKILYKLNPKTEMYERYKRPYEIFYRGSKKVSVSIVPPTGKIVPYVPFDWPHLNRIGLLFNGNEIQHKLDKVFSMDANVDIEAKWKREYSIAEVQAPDFNERLARDSREAVRFNRTMAHQISLDELNSQFQLFGNEFIHYNEVLASTNPEAIAGIFCFSRGLPTMIPGSKVNKPSKFHYEPLEHESVVQFTKDIDYDRYMRLMGVACKLHVKASFGKDVPLYEINKMTNTGLTLVSREALVEEIKSILQDEHHEIEGLIRIIRHQTDITGTDKAIRQSLQKTLNNFLGSDF
ncbi:MAG: hypothetical protein P4L16_06165 [Chlamydiales bacterium]|nr:hypothetical protein [Chlamydiales bacterium]